MCTNVLLIKQLEQRRVCLNIWRSAVLVYIENIPQLHPARSCVLCAGGVDRVLGCSLSARKPPHNYGAVR